MRTRLSVLLVCLGATCTFAQLRPLGSSIFSEREKDGKARQDIGMSVFNQKSPFPSYTPPVQYYGKSNELKKAVDWVNEKPLLPWQPPKPPPSMFGSMHNSNTIGQMESLYRDRLDEYRKTQEQDRKRLQQRLGGLGSQGTTSVGHLLENAKQANEVRWPEQVPKETDRLFGHLFERPGKTVSSSRPLADVPEDEFAWPFTRTNQTGSSSRTVVEGFRKETVPRRADPNVTAKSHYDRGEYQRALSMLQTAAAAGDANAMGNIGILYYYGRGVRKSLEQAATCYREGAEAGSVTHMCNLGYAYLRGHGVVQDDGEAFRWFNAAAQGGSAKAANCVGCMYRVGRGVTRDEARAKWCFEWAMKRGSVEAEVNLLGQSW